MRDSWILAGLFLVALAVAIAGPTGLSQDARYITLVIIGTAYLICHQAETASSADQDVPELRRGA